MEVSNDSPPAPRVSWRAAGKHLARILIGLILIALVATAVSIFSAYRREQEIARDILSAGGRVSFAYSGPDWMPQFFRNNLPYFARIRRVDLFNETSSATPQLGRLANLDVLVLKKSLITDDELQCLAGLNSLRELFLAETQVTDKGMARLKSLSGLQRLDLDRTQVSDAGLKHLSEVTSLHYVCVRDTRTTQTGREAFRSARPKCRMDPHP